VWTEKVFFNCKKLGGKYMASIFLAVGHGVSTDGNWDSGCTDGPYTEANLMFDIVGYAVDMLRANGVDVYTDHDTGNDRNMVYTVRDANNTGVDAYMSVHCDYNLAPSGTYPIVYPGSDGGARLANCVNASVMSRMGLGTRGVLGRDDYEVSYTDMPACIFETGSISQDINTLLNAQPYGYAMAYGIMDYFGVAYDGSAIPASGGSSAPAAVEEAYQWDTENVQYFLNICNYGAPDIDGEWGPETEGCVRTAQAAYHIAVDGMWGHVTEGAASGQIRAYQEALNRHGFKCDIDGIAGPETFNAVKAFQSANGLEADGIVGENTYPKLMA
jgi:N-acetylmuramoyl-L-alanine amidase